MNKEQFQFLFQKFSKRAKIPLIAIYLLFSLSLPFWTDDGNFFPFFSWNLYSSINYPEYLYDFEISEPGKDPYRVSQKADLGSDRLGLWEIAQKAGFSLENDCTHELDTDFTRRIKTLLGSNVVNSLAKVDLIQFKGSLVEYVIRLESRGGLVCKHL